MAISVASDDRSTAILAANDAESATPNSQEIRQPAVPARTVKVQRSPRRRSAKSPTPWRIELNHLLNKGHIFVGYAQMVTERLKSRKKTMPLPFNAERLLALEDVVQLTNSIRKVSQDLENAVNAVVSPLSSCDCSSVTIAKTARRQSTQ